MTVQNNKSALVFSARLLNCTYTFFTDQKYFCSVQSHFWKLDLESSLSYNF